MASPPTLASTHGIWLIAAFLASILQGMGLLQGFLYFLWYPKDHWSFKATVIVMLVIESIQSAAAISNVYTWFIVEFGDLERLNIIPFQDPLQLTALYLSTFVAQGHFARTIFQLHRQNIVIPILVLLLSMAALASGMVQVGLTVGLKKYSDLGTTSASSNLQAAFSLAADVLITVGLCWRLNNSRTGIQSTHKVLNFLIITAINRGVFTMLFAVLNVVLFVSQPGTFYFMLALLLSDKFYMNSMLAVLNTRQHAFKMHGDAVVQQISMSSLSAKNNTVRTVQNGITVSTTFETSRDNISDSGVDGKFSV
ncbi:hypothetical protein C8R44DRAFT_821123 [Mycena epipterygia]|nr:hypothetical protein C8R44DRAFT_821123 [Mycena epipterygia]